MSLSSIFLPSGVNFESKASVYDLICCQTTAVETKSLVSTSGASRNYTDTEKSRQVTQIFVGNPHQEKRGKKISIVTVFVHQPTLVIAETNNSSFCFIWLENVNNTKNWTSSGH